MSLQVLQWWHPGEMVIVGSQKFENGHWLNAYNCDRDQVYSVIREDGVKAALKYYPFKARAMPFSYQNTWIHLGREREASTCDAREWAALQYAKTSK